MEREREEGVTRGYFFLNLNEYNAPIFIVPNGLVSQVTPGDILIDWIPLS